MTILLFSQLSQVLLFLFSLPLSLSYKKGYLLNSYYPVSLSCICSSLQGVSYIVCIILRFFFFDRNGNAFAINNINYSVQSIIPLPPIQSTTKY